MKYEYYLESDELQCPRCLSFEMKDAKTLNIRGFKVCDEKGVWWSQCLVCEPVQKDGGWFATEFNE